MNENALVEQKDLRQQVIERVEVLDKVKTLLLIPQLEVMTTAQVAEYYEVDVDAIQKCYQRNQGEIDSDGAAYHNPNLWRGHFVQTKACFFPAGNTI